MATINTASLKLTSRGYKIGGDEQTAKAVAEVLESRRIPMHSCFKQRVHGLRVIGHTLKDPHGRWAMEFETGKPWTEDDAESVTSYDRNACFQKAWEQESNSVLRPRKYVPIVNKSWWKFW